MARVTELGVWLRGRHVAWLRAPRVGVVTCEYTRAIQRSHDVGTPLLSCSLPVQPGRVRAEAFVNGLLPEGQHRAVMAQRAGVTTSDVLGMLAVFGRDVAGAVTVAALEHPGAASTGEPDDPAERREARVEPLTDADLAAEVARLPEHALGLHDDSELSIAGLQDKLLLVATGNGWGRPVHGYPSTHILKLDDRVHGGVVRAEHACLHLARAAGLAAADSRLMRIGDAECLVVERFDRSHDDGHVRRVHQEDACQALGIDPDRHERRGKYEAFGGPTLRAVASLLDAWGADAEAELYALLQRVVFTVVIGDADAHGKNISLLHPRPGHVRLAPLYDTVPTVLWPSLRAQAAMTVNGVDDLHRITAADVVAEATGWGLSRRGVEQSVAEVCRRLEACLGDGALAATPAVAGVVAERLSRLA